MGVRQAAARYARRIARALDDSQEAPPVEQALRNQVKFTNDLFDSVPVALALRDASGRYLFVNRTWEEGFGGPRHEVVGTRVQDRVPPDVAKRVLALDRAALERGPGGVVEVEDFELRGRHYMQTRSVMADAQGKVLGVLVASLDTTERLAQKQQYEAQLSERARYVNEVLEAMPASVALRDTEGRFLQVNRTWEQYFGIRREEVIGKRFAELPGWKQNPELAALAVAADKTDREALARGPDNPLEPFERPRLGRTYLNTRRAFVDAAGRPLGVLAVSLDTSELRAMESALASERQRLRLVVRATQAGIVDWDVPAQTIWYSGRMKNLLGYPGEADTSSWKSIFEFIHPQDRDRARELFVTELKAAGERGRMALHEPMEFRMQRADGSWIWVQSMGLTQRDETGRVKRYLSAVVDISARRAQEERLREQIALTQAIVAQTPNAIFVKDREGRFTLANRGWSEMSGVPAEKAIGRTVHDLYPAETARRFAREDESLIAQGAAAAPIESVHHGPRPDQYRIVRKAVLSKDDGTVLGLVCSSTDISQLKRMETELRDQMVLTRALIDDNPNAMYVKDTQGRYVTVNDAWLKMVGLTREQAIGRNVLELFPEKESQRYHAEDMRLMTQGEGFSEMESLRTGPGGEPQWVIIRKAALRRADGTVAGLIGTNTDITYLKRIETELANRAKFVSELVDALPISVAMRDTEGRYALVNRTWEHYFGVKREDALGRRRRELPGWQGDPARQVDANEIERIDREMLERGPDHVADPQETLRLGRYYLITRRALFDSSGKAIGVVSAGIDHTERRAMEEALATEQRRLALVVDASRVGTLDWDGVKRTAYYSPRFKEILGYPPDADTSGWPDFFEGIVHSEDRLHVHKLFRDHILGIGPEGKAERHPLIEYRLRRADGSYVWVEAQGVSVRDDKGYVTRFTASYTDITERRAHEEALKESVRLREEVERMSRHDLKTPLNSVIAVSRLLREGGKLARDDEELLSIVERAGYRILNMVNLSLDLYRMEQETYVFHPQAIDLADVAHKVAADLEGQAASKNVALRLRQSGRSLARAEELLCYSLLANLVKNAIEATPEGQVVSVTVEGAGETVSVHVHNPGAVPAAIRARFFDKYASAGKSAGLGLGTYSARLMARVQEGDITLHTSETDGTTVSVRLGAARQPAASPDAPLPAAATGTRAERLPELPALRVLVVDDDEFNRLVLRRYLPSPPLTLAMAVNGRAALDAARNDWPDVVLLDLEMPVMDGYEAAAKLRELEREGRKRLSIVAISSNDDEAIVKRALAAGCDHYLVKPAQRETLFRLLSGEAVPSTTAAAGSSDGPPPKHLELNPQLSDKLPAFLASRRKVLEEAAAALAASDRAALRRLAHRLAGSFALFGFEWAAAKCRSVEHESAQGELAELAARLGAVGAHLDAVEIRFHAKEEEKR
jgi:PAS domain S-box-containing protein